MNFLVRLLMIAILVSAFQAGAQAATKEDPLQQFNDKLKADFTPKTAAPTSPPLASLDKAFANFSQKIQAIEKDLADKVIADLNAAITDATNHNDAISLPCWKSALSLVQALPAEWATPPAQPIGIALGIQIQRDILSTLTGSEATSLKVACAALWGDQLQQITQLGLLFGIKVATGGLL